VEISNDLNVTYRPGYFSLSKQLALLQPTPVQMNSYMPVNTELPCYNLNITEVLGKRECNCTAYGGKEIINPVLPFTPNARVCSCMLQSIDCVVRPGLDEEMIRNSERDMCAKNQTWCSATRSNISEGLYPSYLFCNNTESLSWELQQQYLHNGNDSAACSSAGGVIQHAIPTTSLPSDCREFLRQAGPDGTGTITFTPTSTIQSNFLNSQSSDLQTRTKIGIGVGIGSFGIFAATLLALYWRAKRKGRSSSQLDEYQKAELPDNSAVVPIGSEILLDGAEINELEGATAELDQEQVNELCGIQVNEIGGGKIVELDGDPIDRKARPQ
jgi:X8 domain